MRLFPTVRKREVIPDQAERTLLNLIRYLEDLCARGVYTSPQEIREQADARVRMVEDTSNIPQIHE